MKENIERNGGEYGKRMRASMGKNESKYGTE